MLSKPGKAQYDSGSVRCGFLITISYRIEDEHSPHKAKSSGK